MKDMVCGYHTLGCPTIIRLPHRSEKLLLKYFSPDGGESKASPPILYY
jgi:hypothetical protein